MGAHIVDSKTGHVIGDISPLFAHWGEEEYKMAVSKNELKLIEPMTATEVDNIDYADKIAEEKYDGHRCLLYLTKRGNRAFSRRISKKTKYYSENTDQMPHIRDSIPTVDMNGTILDGEIILPVEGCTCRKVQSVLGANPPKAIDFQMNNGFAYLSAFDIISYKGVSVVQYPLWKRKELLIKAVKELACPWVKLAPMYCNEEVYELINQYTSSLNQHLNLVDSYDELYQNFIKRGKEGLMIKGIHNIYEFKRTKHFIKLKPHLTFDVVIMGYDEPEKIFEGKTLREKGYWDYWEDTDTKEIIIRSISAKEADIKGYVPVTKFYAMDWIGAVKFGVWKDGALVEVGQTSGFNEQVRKMISEDKEGQLGQVIEVMAQCIINKETGSLQHPRYIQHRPDKDSTMCTFEAHVRDVK